MPTTRTVTMDEGIDGHRSAVLTEWDYDRAGGAYALKCECGWKSQEHWNWGEAKAQFAAHVRAVVKSAELALLSDAEVAEGLKESTRHWVAHRYDDWVLEAIRRLGREIGEADVR